MRLGKFHHIHLGLMRWNRWRSVIIIRIVAAMDAATAFHQCYRMPHQLENTSEQRPASPRAPTLLPPWRCLLLSCHADTCLAST
eukprot:scaffold67906_cov24-Cyclotella_meneghiniana.AAC.3